MRSPAEWPIRWRLTLVFSAAMALVLAAAGAVTVVQFRDAAHEADPDGALRGLTDDITADLVRELVTILPIVLDHQDAHTRHPAACPARAATSSHRRFICHPYRRSRTPSQRGRQIRRKR